MPDFLIHRDPNGQIVLAIPYANIMVMRIKADSRYATEVVGSHIKTVITGEVDYGIYYMLSNGRDDSFAVDNRETADRYLSEWREWWEEHSKHSPYSSLRQCCEEGG